MDEEQNNLNAKIVEESTNVATLMEEVSESQLNHHIAGIDEEETESHSNHNIAGIDEEETNNPNENIVEETVVEVTEGPRTPRPTLYEMNETPGGSTNYVPHVEGIHIPVEGTYYNTLDEAFDMYVKYAEMAGFEVRKGGQKTGKSGGVLSKYIYCNKEGLPKPINIDTLHPESVKQKRNTVIHVTDCKAHIRLVFDSVSGRYKLVTFNPKHNHMFIIPEYRHFTKKQRKMNNSEKMFVVKAAANKIGATKAHHLYSSMKGGYEHVHGTVDDFKNHQRDVNKVIGESDAQLLINKMENRLNYTPNFSFVYKVDNSELVMMFWADEVAKCNYREFGDIVSFDATFNSNRYNMKFVPFIGIDNHGKCVTLGSGMILHEDAKSYIWLLEAFMEAFGKEPTMIVTDQYGAMKKAIQTVFKKAKHRLCMWHIMQKIPTKICKEVYDKADFKERFNKIVWNMFIIPSTFEEKWAQLIEAFDLKSNNWLTKMFDMREIWIPAYFIDSPLFGLMRTTSRSESENSFFKSFTSPGATLVSFMMSYESAMERQRFRQEYLDFETCDGAPKFKTPLAIERNAAKIYTRTIFLIVQIEIDEGSTNCMVQTLSNAEGCEHFGIRDKNPNENKSLFHIEKQKKGKPEKKTSTVAQPRDYKVLLNTEDGSVVCSCRNFMRYGFLCRHIFCVFKNRDINVIPKQYVLRRWTRDIIPPDLRRRQNRYGEKNVTIERLTNEANFVMDDTLFWIGKDEKRLGTYVSSLKKLFNDVKVDLPNPPSRDTLAVIEDLFSVKKTNDIPVKNPTRAVNKGEKVNKGETVNSEETVNKEETVKKTVKKGGRLKSNREKAITVLKKKARPCLFCKEVTNEHTKTTCPLNPKARKKRKVTPIFDV